MQTFLQCVNLPWLFTYQKHPVLHIPNATNSLDGYFSKLKQLLNTHRGDDCATKISDDPRNSVLIISTFC